MRRIGTVEAASMALVGLVAGFTLAVGVNRLDSGPSPPAPVPLPTPHGDRGVCTWDKAPPSACGPPDVVLSCYVWECEPQ